MEEEIRVGLLGVAHTILISFDDWVALGYIIMYNTYVVLVGRCYIW